MKVLGAEISLKILLVKYSSMYCVTPIFSNSWETQFCIIFKLFNANRSFMMNLRKCPMLIMKAALGASQYECHLTVGEFKACFVSQSNQPGQIPSVRSVMQTHRTLIIELDSKVKCSVMLQKKLSNWPNQLQPSRPYHLPWDCNLRGSVLSLLYSE